MVRGFFCADANLKSWGVPYLGFTLSAHCSMTARHARADIRSKQSQEP